MLMSVNKMKWFKENKLNYPLIDLWPFSSSGNVDFVLGQLQVNTRVFV